MFRFWRKHFMALEATSAVVVGLAFVIWTEWDGGRDAVQGVLAQSRHDIYSTLASISGALLGFVLTAVSIVVGFSSFRQLAVVRESPHYRTLYTIFFQTTTILAAATLADLLALIFDRDDQPMPIFLYLVVITSLLAIVRVARCVWVLEQVVMLVVDRPPSKAHE